MSRKAKKRLTGKQQNFVNEYLIDLNATAAAKRAGYSVKSAYHSGWENLRKPEIVAEISKRQKRMAEKLEITQEMVVQELGKLAFSNIGDYLRIDADGAPYLDFSGLTEAQTAALTSVTVDVFIDGSGDDASAVKRLKFLPIGTTTSPLTLWLRGCVHGSLSPSRFCPSCTWRVKF